MNDFGQTTNGIISHQVIGPSSHTIDSDGRMIIPQRMRMLLGGGFWLTRGVEKCLWMMPGHSFAKLSELWGGDNVPLDRDSRRLVRQFAGLAVQVIPDKQMRIVIPAHLKEWAGITSDSELVAMGMGDYVELWDGKTWREFEAKQSSEDIQDAIDRKKGIAPVQIPAQMPQPGE